MKVVLAGAYGHLGSDVFRALLNAGHEVVATDVVEKDLGLTGNFTFKKLDVTDPEALKGLCDGADVLVSTVGLTKASATVTPMEIDYQGNVNLLNEALAAGVKHFAYVSVIKAEKAPDIPMLAAKAKFEKVLKDSGMTYTIYRPTGYFYDIVKVFRPMIEKGEVQLLGKDPIRANVIATEDFAEFIVQHMCDDCKSYDIGGKETYTYEEIAQMCFDAAGKECVIKRVPGFVFDMIGLISKLKGDGRAGVIKFGKWTMTEDMVGDTEYGDRSFKQYIYDSFKKE